MNLGDTLSEHNPQISSATEGAQKGGTFTFNLDFFSGPLDLLLHLVRQQEVPVEQVQMSLIANQYLEIISHSKVVDLDKAAEFLVIAATLMSIKSQSLVSNSGVEEDDDNYEESSFYEQLRERLKIYELTKLRAEALRALPQLGVDTFVRQDKKALDFSDEETFAQDDPSTLAKAFVQLLKRVGQASRSFLIRMEPISIVSFMMKVVDHVKLKAGSHRFADLVYKFAREKQVFAAEASANSATKRGVIIGSLIAVLELGKRGLIRAEQTEDSGEISVSYHQAGDLASEIQFSSEFDGADSTQDTNVVQIAEYRELGDQNEVKEVANLRRS